MADLITDDRVWSEWKGSMPLIYNVIIERSESTQPSDPDLWRMKAVRFLSPASFLYQSVTEPSSG